MMFYILTAPLLLVAAYRVYRLVVNYLAARSFRLPIILLPTSAEDPLWLLLRPLFSWVEKLPFGLGRWYRYTDFGWPTIDGQETVSKIGETFVLVSPQRTQIITANPSAAEQIFKDRSFILPAPYCDTFTVYGQNVSSTNGSDWQRHRKVTASAFNEWSNHVVWNQSIQQTKDMLGPIYDSTTWSLALIREKLSVLAMHVLAAAAFGQSTKLTTISNGHKMTLMDSLGFILKNVFVSILFSGLKLPDFMLPPVLKKLKLSVAEFRLYMEESVLRQMQASTKSDPSSKSVSLLEAMISANESEKQGSQKSQSKPSFLTESELYGNLFVFNLAGFETTAGTMTFALPYLAAHPDVQDWLLEEIDDNYTNATNVGYEETYPKLTRCLAFMQEVLRFASPAPQMVREPTAPTTLLIGPNTSVTVNPGTLVFANFFGLHLSPRWGADVNEFNPKRWVTTSANGGEALAPPPEGAAFMPWAVGSRVCPGKKFSQVEHGAVITHLLSQFRVEMVKIGSESDESAKARLLGVLDEKYFNVSAHLKRPNDASIRLVRRGDAQKK